MKRVLVFFAALVFILASNLAYAGQFGAPEPTAKEGKVALGVGYFHYSGKFKPKDSGWEETKATSNQAYLKLGYGFMKNAEVYIRAGGADLKIPDFITDTDITNSGPKDFKDGLKPFGTLGIKGLFSISNSFGIGPFIQATIYSGYKDELSYAELGWADQGSVKTKVKNPYEINLGLGAQGKIGEVIIYGGPVAYINKSKAQIDVQNLTTGNSATVSTTYKEKNNVGGFAGLRIPLSKSFSLEAEGQLKSRFSFGGALTYSF